MDHRALDVCSKLHNELHLIEYAAYHSGAVMFLPATEVEYLPILIPLKMYMPITYLVIFVQITGHEGLKPLQFYVVALGRHCAVHNRTLYTTGHNAGSYLGCYNPCERQWQSNKLMQAAHSVNVPVCILWLTVVILSIYYKHSNKSFISALVHFRFS